MPFQSIAPATPGGGESTPSPTVIRVAEIKSESCQPKPQGIVTSKEWVLPPRPKPGRKPSTDTPSSKRKAQNRQAQRAFRQRKAAKISEIEKQYMEIDQSRQKKQDQLQQSLEALARENARLRLNLESVQRQQSLSQSPVPASNDQCGLCDSEAECVCVIRSDELDTKAAIPLPRRIVDPIKKGNKMPRALTITSSNTMETDFTATFSSSNSSNNKIANNEILIESEESTSIDPCGFCSNGTPCLCAEAAKEDRLQRRQEQQHTPSHFRFNSQSGSSARPVLPPIAPGEGTKSKSYQRFQGDILSSPSSPVTSTYTDATTSSSSVCSGNPATCAQCRSDPMSTLFCTSLNVLSRAAEIQSSTDKAEEEAKAKAKIGAETPPVIPSTPAGETCGCGGSSGGDCSLAEHTIASPASIIDDEESKAAHTTKITTPITTQATTTITRYNSNNNAQGTYIPCSAAYQTLSRHKNFNNADFGNLVGKLQTRGMQVEVNSVAKVLRELDRRFVAS